jgi:peptidoglycan/LPS O-acetylase OafA/YrhL
MTAIAAAAADDNKLTPVPMGDWGLDGEESFQAYRATRYFGSLDGLRGMSILAVVWHHSLSGHGHDAGFRILERGYHGVGLFFAISGFLITTLLLRERDRHGRIDYPSFFKRRALRIFPLFYAVLALYCVVVPLVHGGTAREAAFFANLPYHLVYLSNWLPEAPFGHAWSLACEEQFYLVWPWVMILFAGLRPLVGVLALWAFKLLLFGGVLAGRFDPESFAVAFFSKIPDSILAGILAAFALHHPRGHAIARGLVAWPGAPFVAAAAVGAALWSPWHHEQYLWLPLSFALLVASVVIREDQAAASILKRGPLPWLGRVSYGVYLIHMLVLAAIARAAGAALPAGSPGRFLAALLASTLLALLSFRYFEKPFLSMKERFSR